MAAPDIYEVELRDGRATPLPDYVNIVEDAQYWGISPMEAKQWPLYWIEAGRIMRQAKSRAAELQKK